MSGLVDQERGRAAAIDLPMIVVDQLIVFLIH
jgi:hypothetical protein